jgi:hypothetical protein
MGVFNGVFPIQPGMEDLATPSDAPPPAVLIDSHA